MDCLAVCRALPCRALPCLASPRHASPRHALPSQATPRPASPGRALPRLASPCQALPCPAKPYPAEKVVVFWGGTFRQESCLPLTPRNLPARICDSRRASIALRYWVGVISSAGGKPAMIRSASVSGSSSDLRVMLARHPHDISAVDFLAPSYESPPPASEPGKKRYRAAVGR